MLTKLLITLIFLYPITSTPGDNLINDLVLDNGIYVRLNGDIVQVAINKAATVAYEGNKLLRYGLNDEGVWDKSALVKVGEGYGSRWKFYFLGSVPTGRVLMYTPAITTVYFDPDFGEENIVVLFRPEVSSEFKKEWIKQTVKFIKGYHKYHEERL